MLSKSNKEKKVYYSIGEVARMFDVNEATLRYWENEFTFISPRRAGRQVRQYTEEDIAHVRLVHHLVKEQGMTIQGAKQRLKSNKQEACDTMDVIHRLQAVREELARLRQELDSVV
ncbi:MAG: MerR family transcriptional regulator [Bacteroidales bacterium]|nr:MerR family transcriptional regulator [Bacteroidales bacterium]